MTNSKVQCPRCHSKDLYKYGKDPHGNQKYQCKECKRQFAPKTLKTTKTRERKYPSCPKCGKATFLHHDYEYYSNLRCCDKKCNHSFIIPKPTSIADPSYTNLKGKTSFKGMRYPVHTILLTLYLYYLNQSSTREISKLLDCMFNIQVSHVTIAAWSKKFAPIFQSRANELKPTNLSESDEWHTDETVVKINGQKHYLWAILDSETRFVLSFHLSPYRDSRQAFTLFNDAKKNFEQPNAIVSDRYHAYNAATKAIFTKAEHIKVQSFKDDISNNIIESFFGTFKSWAKRRRGFNSFASANQLITMFMFFYNYIRPHSGLNDLTPAQVAGIKYTDQQRKTWLLTA
ncbi:IS6 family transposase [Sporohalobacter salinus]|uniref:IS6 family transposase n=1 Tax=Sporohalobacter salinus TaxID=1494606 RepID=UPI001960AAC3|nr:IS6 family transposase [Sporohalobacter salinus]MBM7625152.1 transposase-like protein/DNA-directed RNA polymerase subunit RPC12/RpoP [Sporohalobacter salinus]